ncbi:2-hydroxyacyl-CoA dehydratase family protein [Amnibacterium kyonggiense]|uniref:2-hydroxyglutaryl-CoA dehydratase D-component n=1 Tax=Amnibacterium kyonggiense TaxID=595671 RepID=A0A4R7FCH6_9MICO|nr:2-hydroxyacyl-CoA dehydratase family protein [Amnibacterium kyonggiense]TDS74461.1 2-hydroxyglutaryl-CoA dehydratase D-component [Amnibacterium kyonggiense]
MSRLAATTAALAHQREWFGTLRARAAAGEVIALVNADAPQEILRAMDVPYVVNQWWASVVTAKQLAGESLAVVAGLGHPDDSRQYDVLALGSRGVADQEALWGGLPKPGIVIAELSGDATGKVFEAWTDDPDVAFFPYERTAALPAPERWWDEVAHDWSSIFGADRIALMAEENRELIAFLEERTGRTFELERLRTVMDLINEQEELNRRTRDLVAAARPTPVRVTDTIPAVMIPQWHRGSEWGRAAAQALHDEVAALVDAGAAVVPEERVRLMWVGRGLWGDTALYRRFEEELGAVFVWSMYLAIAADGYIRYGDDPIETLAARFVGVTDLLYAPPLAPQWYVKEAATHGVDGVVHLVADDVAGARFITLALEEAGVPVLEIRASNADPRALERADVGGSIARFVATLGDGRGEDGGRR